MSMNSFDSESGVFCVLINDNGEGWHSPWSILADAPVTWTIMRGAETRKYFLDNVGELWTDMQPKGRSSGTRHEATHRHLRGVTLRVASSPVSVGPSCELENSG
jgi:uncharacterized protein YbdZ (MbtH family)